MAISIQNICVRVRTFLCQSPHSLVSESAPSEVIHRRLGSIHGTLIPTLLKKRFEPGWIMLAFGGGPHAVRLSNEQIALIVAEQAFINLLAACLRFGECLLLGAPGTLILFGSGEEAGCLVGAGRAQW